MTAERSRRVEELFHLALGRGEDERAAFLAAACGGDESLRSEVERLLRADAGARDFLETPAIEVAARSTPGPLDTTVGATRPEPPPVLAPGETLNGRWVIERKLARGGIGEVYVARDSRLLNRRVVVKTLLEKWLSDSWVTGKFRQEMEALTRVEHGGVVGVLDAGLTPDGTPYLVMQYIEGIDLGRVLAGGRLALARAAHVAAQASRALAAAHEAGVLHRDLKPSNIMLRRTAEGEEEVKLIDFGIAKVKDSQVAESTDVARSVGSVSYMSPEQLRAEPLSAASDVYALGVIAYEMVTGRKPFGPASPFLLPEMQREGVRLRPRELRQDLPEAAEAVILKALSFNPVDRQQSAREFGEAFERAMTEGQPSARDGGDVKTPAAAPARAGRTRRTLLWLAAAALLSAASAALVVFTLSGREEEKPAQEQPPAAVTRTLTYWIDVQKYRGGIPYGKPFRLPGEIIFEKDDHIWLGVSAPQPGHLYILDEYPRAEGDRPKYVLLFPMPFLNGGQASIAAGHSMTIPDEEGFVFDSGRGTERLWLVYSASVVPELEAVKGVANRRQKGEITDPAQAEAVRAFIERRRATPPRAEKNEQSRLTTLSGEGDVLVHVIPLEHY